jgi:hypothetical protein
VYGRIAVAIRLRLFDGQLVALCAAKTEPAPGDIYLDDNAHHGLAAKFARDWRGQTVDWEYPAIDKIAESVEGQP